MNSNSYFVLCYTLQGRMWRPMSAQKLLQHQALGHMPTRVVYLSAAAAAAVEDSGIRVGRKAACVGASAPTSSEATVHQKGKLLTTVLQAHAPALQKATNTRARLRLSLCSRTARHAAGKRGLHKPCWKSCSTTTRPTRQ